MPITLAGVDLLLPTRRLCELIGARLPVAEAFPWAASAWPGPALDAGTPGAPAATMPRDLAVNRFYWPQGASRWAYGAFLASARMADEVRSAAGDDTTLAGVTGGGAADGSRSTPIPLELSTPRDGEDAPEVLAVTVRLLRVVQLTQLEADPDSGFEPNNLVLLVVVDDRFYWQSAPCPDFGILPYGSYNPYGAVGGSPLSAGDPDAHGGDGAEMVPAKPTWAGVLAKLATALGAGITFPDVPAEYLQPDPSLNLAGMPAGPALDAALFNCGLRLVANYDGSFTAQDAPSAIAARQADDRSAAGQARALRGGGDAFRDDL